MAQDAEQYAEEIVAAVTQPIVVLAGELRVEKVNPAFCQCFQVAEDEVEGRQFHRLGNGQWDIPELRRLLEETRFQENEVNGYRVEHDFERIGRRIMRLNARRMPRSDGAGRVLLAIDDTTETERRQKELEGRKEFAEKLIDSVREGLVVLDWELNVQTANSSFYEQFRVGPEETEGRKIHELGNGQWNIPELRDLLERVLPEETTFNDFEVEHDFEGIGRRTMLLNGRRLDHLDRIILAIRDITERRRHERQQQAFMAELQHRVKNILNNVRALASQTRRRTSDLDRFYDGFMARLDALARTQDLLVRSPEQDADLSELVQTELECIGAERGGTYTVEGPPVRLSPLMTQALGMAVHELATNAGKYGALKARDGRVTVAWRVEGDDQVHLRWREHGVTIPNVAVERGFGTEVIESSVPYMLGGSASLTLNPDGAECRIVFPLDEKDGEK